MRFLRRLLCGMTFHSWVPTVVEARMVLCECAFCGTRRWITISCFDKRS